MAKNATNVEGDTPKVKKRGGHRPDVKTMIQRSLTEKGITDIYKHLRENITGVQTINQVVEKVHELTGVKVCAASFRKFLYTAIKAGRFPKTCDLYLVAKRGRGRPKAVVVEMTPPVTEVPVTDEAPAEVQSITESNEVPEPVAAE